MKRRVVFGAFAAITANGNGAYGIVAREVKRSTNTTAKIEGCTITNNLGGVAGTRSSRITGSTVSDSEWVGVVSSRGALIQDSVIVDNGRDPDCPAENGFQCADVVLGQRPRLTGTTTCGTSLNASQPGFGCYETWGVCEEDSEVGLCPQP